ncbi:hypothetical protein EV121DRAFT_284893 [Schizophyllum commune]
MIPDDQVWATRPLLERISPAGVGLTPKKSLLERLSPPKSFASAKPSSNNTEPEAIPRDDEQRFRDALAAQLRIIDSIDRVRDGGGARGSIVAGGLNGQAQPPTEDEHDGHGDGNGTSEGRLTGKRVRSPVADYNDDDGDAGDTPRKRIDTRLFAWAASNDVDRTILPHSVVETNRHLENFSRDPKGAKTHLFNSFGRPQFPAGEWGNLLSGNAVDFDCVSSSIHSVAINTRTVQRLGELELSFGHATPTKTVKDHGEWVIAWNAFRRAAVFVFPHLAEELDAYAQHILGFFRAFPSHGDYHQRVINYDRAVRIRIAERRDLRYIDFAAFTDLQLMWIHAPITVAAVPDSPKHSDGKRARRGGGGTDARREPCNRWNAGTCPNSTASCRYAHVCRRCRSNRHVEDSCAKDN